MGSGRWFVCEFFSVRGGSVAWVSGDVSFRRMVSVVYSCEFRVSVGFSGSCVGLVGIDRFFYVFFVVVLNY